LPNRERQQLIYDVSTHAFGGIFARPEEAALHQLGMIHARRDFAETVLTMSTHPVRIFSPFSEAIEGPMDPDAPRRTHRADYNGYRESTPRQLLYRSLPSHFIDTLEREGFFERVRRGEHDDRAAADFVRRATEYLPLRDPMAGHRKSVASWDLLKRFQHFLEYQFEAENMGPTADFTTTASWAPECNSLGGFRHPEVTFSAWHETRRLREGTRSDASE
jgi:hypothetical protein